MEINGIPPLQTTGSSGVCLEILLFPERLDNMSQNKYVSNMSLLVHKIKGPQYGDSLIVSFCLAGDDKKWPWACADFQAVKNLQGLLETR
jgi:hypothetical protein